jgi:hypothetical protein
MSVQFGVRFRGTKEGKRPTPHSEDLPWMTLKYIPEISGHSGHRFQKYESTITVKA